MDATNEAVFRHERDMLATALFQLLVAMGVIGHDAQPNGPELVMVAEDLAAHHLVSAPPPGAGATT